MAEVVGKLVKKLQLESGVSKAGKQWEKITFVLTLKKGGKFPKELHLDVFNSQQIQFVSDTSIDTVLKCNIELTSREYKGRYFYNVYVAGIEVIREEDLVHYPSSNTPQDIAFGASDTGDGGDMDLPF